MLKKATYSEQHWVRLILYTEHVRNCPAESMLSFPSPEGLPAHTWRVVLVLADNIQRSLGSRAGSNLIARVLGLPSQVSSLLCILFRLTYLGILPFNAQNLCLNLWPPRLFHLASVLVSFFSCPPTLWIYRALAKLGWSPRSQATSASPSD